MEVRLGQLAVEVQIAEDIIIVERPALEVQIERGADGAVRALAVDEVRRAHLLQLSVVAGERGDDPAVPLGLGEGGQGDAALDGHALGVEGVAEHALGDGLRDEQQVVVAAVDAGEVEPEHLLPAAPRAGRLGGVAGVDELVGQPALVEQLERPRLHPDRPRGGRRLLQPVDDADGDPHPRELQRRGHAGRAGADDEDRVDPGLRRSVRHGSAFRERTSHRPAIGTGGKVSLPPAVRNHQNRRGGAPFRPAYDGRPANAGRTVPFAPSMSSPPGLTPERPAPIVPVEASRTARKRLFSDPIHGRGRRAEPKHRPRDFLHHNPTPAHSPSADSPSNGDAPQAIKPDANVPDDGSTPTTEIYFQDLGLVPKLLENVARAGYEFATPIQAQAIPPVLDGRDVLAGAPTGTGKTAAFVLPILQRIMEAGAGGHAHGPGAATRGRPTRALVLCPTRELAVQISESLNTYGRGTGLRHVCIYGGVGQNPQVRSLRSGVDVVVATPGRLEDLMEQGHVDLSNVGVLVLDEADRMLDMGFVPAVRRIGAELPKQRQTLMFSATVPPTIRALVDELMDRPVRVEVVPEVARVDAIEQAVYFVRKGDKPQLLADLIENHQIFRGIVFSRTKHGADRIVRRLEDGNIPAASIHGNKSQGQRQRALDGFKSGRVPILVATDVAARGIDVDGVTHVINYDLTHEPETYVHRIGRTARAGATGVALSFCDGDEREWLRDIQRLIGRELPVVSDHPYADGEQRVPLRPERGGGNRGGGNGGGGKGGPNQRRSGRGPNGRPQGPTSRAPSGRPDAERESAPAHPPRGDHPLGKNPPKTGGGAGSGRPFAGHTGGKPPAKRRPGSGGGGVVGSRGQGGKPKGRAKAGRGVR